MNIEIQRLLHKDHRASSITNREKSPYFEKLEFEVFSSVEALVVFTLFYTIGSNIKSFYQKDFEAFLLIKIKDLISTSNFYIRKTEDFACGVLPILEYSIKTSKKPFSDFCFNIIKRKWDSWEDIGIYDPENILTDFTSCDLNVKELVHFNKEFLNIESFQNQIENETLEMYLLPKNHIYCETLTWKKMNYFVNLAMAYLKPMTIVSNQQNGKTNFVKEKVWNLLSKADYSTFQLGLTRQTTILQVFS